MKPQPDFLIIGAMKSATTTLQKQLSLQPGIFMTTPKEPNYFSDNEVYELGDGWYGELYKEAAATDILGEASTHYTKLPTYPETISRMCTYLEGTPKFIYIIRHPIDRLISHYKHEWSENNAPDSIEKAIASMPELIAYSSYHQQLSPYLETFGKENILLIFYDSLLSNPQKELERSAQFIGHKDSVHWVESESKQNASSERIRKFPGIHLLLDTPILEKMRRTLVPKSARNWVKGKLSVSIEPELSANTLTHLQAVFDQDLKALGELLDIELNCTNFKQRAVEGRHDWI